MPSDVASNSQLRCFKRCKRKYWLTYVRKLKQRRFPFTGARQLGTRVHGALQGHYSGLDAFECLEALKLIELANTGEDALAADAILKEHDMALAMLQGYMQWLEEEAVDIDLEVTSTEQLLRAPSPVEGVDLIGKLDLGVRKISSGVEGFLDFKTVGDLQTPLKYLNQDEQFRMYALMQRLLAVELGFEPPRFQIYRMLKKSKRTARAKPPFFKDYEVYINEEELRAMWTRIAGELADMLDFEVRIEANPELHRSIAYPNPTQTCSWDCDFYTVCPLFDDSRSDPEYLIAANYVLGDPHEHYDGQLAGVDIGLPE